MMGRLGTGGAATGAIALLLVGCGDRSWLGVGVRQIVDPGVEASFEDAGDDSTDVTQGEPEGGEVGVEEPVGRDVAVEDRVDGTVEASEASDAPSCDYGTVVSDAFGATVFFAGGAGLPAGRYRVRYLDGCMKDSTNQA